MKDTLTEIECHGTPGDIERLPPVRSASRQINPRGMAGTSISLHFDG